MNGQEEEKEMKKEMGVKQSLQALRRINRLKASSMKKKQQLSKI